MATISTVLLLVVIFTTESLQIAPDGSAGGHKISLNRSADDKVIGKPNRSASVDHICSPNPCGPGSFCLNCAVHNCSNQTSKDHLCLCQLGQTWKICDDPVLDACEGHKCLNEAECVPRAKGHRCLCQPGFTGEFCDGKVPLQPVTCKDSLKIDVILGFVVVLVIFSSIRMCDLYCFVEVPRKQ